MSGLRDALVNGLTHYNFCYAEIHASEPSIAMPEEVELVADAVLRVLAEHGDTQQVREQVTDALFYASDERITFESDPSLLELVHAVMAVVAPILAARDAAVERAELRLTQLRLAHGEMQRLRELPARPAGHETGQ